MPEPDDFFEFAAEHAAELVALGHVVTGNAAAGERLAEAALLKAFRRWPWLTGHGDPSLAVRRWLTAAARRGGRIARPTFAGSLDLQDVYEETYPSKELDEAGRNERLWDALPSISRHERLVLALRLHSGLSIAETARVLRRPPRHVSRIERRALNELSLAADLGVAVLVHPVGDPAAGAAAAELPSWVSEAIRTHIGSQTDVQPLLRRLTTVTVRQRQRRRSFPVLTAAAAALLLVATGSVLLWTLLAGNSSDDRDPAVRNVSMPLSPAGTHLVGFGNVAVAVPVDWLLSETPCGRTAAERARPPSSEEASLCATAERGSSVRLTEAPYNYAPLYAPPARTAQVGGKVAQLTALNRVEGVYQQTVFVFGADFMMTVRSRDLDLIDELVTSVTAVPDGFTVVPVCEQLPITEAAAALEAAGLVVRIAHTSALSPRYGEPPVTFQSRDAGSVVPKGTPVGLTIPSF